jgi:hypothetical protein
MKPPINRLRESLGSVRAGRMGRWPNHEGTQQVRAIEVLLHYAFGKPQSKLIVSMESVPDVARLKQGFLEALSVLPDEQRYAVARKLLELDRAPANNGNNLNGEA